MKREKLIIRTSVQGIFVNLALVISKAAVGLIAGSVSIVLDAVNNLTDMLSSIVTIVGTKMAGREPDRDHPYGHGRIEYLTAMVVGLIVMAAGVMALIEAVPKIFHPEVAEYSAVTIIIVVIAIIVKLAFGSYVKRTGDKIKSGSLSASGLDAMLDALLSAGTLVGVIVTMIWGVSIDGWIGAAISLFIIKSSIGILHEGWLDIIGRRVDGALSRKIKTRIAEFPEVSGAYDLVLHNYGPNEVIGSVHIQVPDDLTAKQIHKLSWDIAAAVYKEFRVYLTVGIYAENTSDRQGSAIRAALESIVAKTPAVLQMHGFYVDDAARLVVFDLIISYQEKDRNRIKNRVLRALRKQFPDYKYIVNLDADVSD